MSKISLALGTKSVVLLPGLLLCLLGSPLFAQGLQNPRAMPPVSKSMIEGNRFVNKKLGYSFETPTGWQWRRVKGRSNTYLVMPTTGSSTYVLIYAKNGPLLTEEIMGAMCTGIRNATRLYDLVFRPRTGPGPIEFETAWEWRIMDTSYINQAYFFSTDTLAFSVLVPVTNKPVPPEFDGLMASFENFEPSGGDLGGAQLFLAFGGQLIIWGLFMLAGFALNQTGSWPGFNGNKVGIGIIVFLVVGVCIYQVVVNDSVVNLLKLVGIHLLSLMVIAFININISVGQSPFRESHSRVKAKKLDSELPKLRALAKRNPTITDIWHNYWNEAIFRNSKEDILIAGRALLNKSLDNGDVDQAYQCWERLCLTDPTIVFPFELMYTLASKMVETNCHYEVGPVLELALANHECLRFAQLLKIMPLTVEYAPDFAGKLLPDMAKRPGLSKDDKLTLTQLWKRYKAHTSLGEVPVANSAHDQPGPSGYHEPVPVAFHEPVSSGFHEPVPSGFHQPVPSGFHQPVPSGFHQPVPAGFHEPVPAGFHQPVPSGIHEPVPSTFQEPEPSSFNDNTYSGDELSAFFENGPSQPVEPIPLSYSQPEPVFAPPVTFQPQVEIRLWSARLVSLEPKGLILAMADHSTKTLAYNKVENISVGVINPAGKHPFLVMDLILDDLNKNLPKRRVIRLNSKNTNPSMLFPQVEANLAWQHLAGILLQATRATAVPSANAALGRNYVVFPNVAALESSLLRKTI